MNTPKEIRTEIVINATPAQVWKRLTDFTNYPKWNPFIKSIKGELKDGGKITARIEPPGASGMTFTPKLLSVKPHTELRWLGHLFFPGLFDGEHIFELYENTDGSTTFVQREIFRGILVPLFSKMLDNNTVKGFEAMNQKLKAIAENGTENTSTGSKSSPLRTLIIMLTLLISFGSVLAQSKFQGRELAINFFRNPSVGVEYRVDHFSIHAGYYPTNFKSA